MIFPDFKKEPVSFKRWMDDLVDRYERKEFIELDPVSIPHQFYQQKDREIAGFFAATLSWGNRTTIIRKCNELFECMDGTPHDFIVNHKPSDLKAMEGFVHRTFNDTDLLYFVHRLKRLYNESGNLENAFFSGLENSNDRVKDGLIQFRKRFFNDPDAPVRTGKHVASPERGSACKRLNMFLRWMVRSDNRGVDFGIWTAYVKPADLYCPLDVHVALIARQIGLLNRKQDDWRACAELTQNLRKLDPSDPVQYDYALFSAGINKLLMP